jgi:uncharacterized protein (DUF302 family)
MLAMVPEWQRLSRCGRSNRPALTRLAWLVAADPSVARRLLDGETPEAAMAHPHYVVLLDDDDRETLADLRTRSHTVEEFLSGLAAAADGAVP